MRSPLNKVSKNPQKAARRFVPRPVIKEVKERSGGRCECIIHEGEPYRELGDVLRVHGLKVRLDDLYRCGNSAEGQPHHVLARSQGGKHEATNLFDICFYHHLVWIPANVKKAILNGLVQPYRGFTH